MSEDRCICCGEIVPEGRMVCPNCEKQKPMKNLSHGEMVQIAEGKKNKVPRYIDGDAVIEELRQIYNDCDDWENHISQSDIAESEKRILTNRASATKMAMIEVRLRVDKIPTADVVEVVRCKDCKWNDYDCTMCMNPNLALGGDYTSCLYIEPNWFCPDGERKEKADG